MWFAAAERSLELSDASGQPYFQPVAEMSPAQLELIVRHSTYLQSCLNARKKPMSSVNLDGARPITWVHILRGQWLLTASSDASSSELSLWYLHDVLSAGGHGRKPVPAATAYLEGPVANGCVEVQDECVVIALEIRSP